MTHSQFLRDLWVIAILGAVYFVADKLGLMLALVNPSATAVWPLTGIALAVFLLLGYRGWPGILLGTFLVNVTT
ncbi:MAG: MASE1 domain-containing protein, partial [Nitrospira sp.]|nr:MASE1 domain-containing protein [Nitrospira sp.]